MRPSCECCDTDLPAESDAAVICSYECTWCQRCADGLGQRCPNCGGTFAARPPRTGDNLRNHPASTERVTRSQPCPHPETTDPLASLTRHTERAADERAVLDEILDDGIVGTLATVVSGRPWVVPMLYARDGDRILIHGSTGAGALRHVAAGAPVALAVTHIDGLVVAHTTFESSANYRSAVIRGQLVPLEGEQEAAALDVLSDHIIPGRVAEVRASNRKEYAATIAMALPIVDGQWTVKTSTGFSDLPEPGDEGTDAWIGVVPMRTHYGPAETAPFSGSSTIPPSVQRLQAGPE